MEKLIDLIVKHRMILLGAFIGLVLAILFLTIGFWRTLLIVAMMVVFAVLFGCPNVRRALARFFKTLGERLGDKSE